MHNSDVLRVTSKSKLQALRVGTAGPGHEALRVLRRRNHVRAVAELQWHVVLQHAVLVLVCLREVRELILFPHL